MNCLLSVRAIDARERAILDRNQVVSLLIALGAHRERRTDREDRARPPDEVPTDIRDQ